jgi:hypothetical protein
MKTYWWKVTAMTGGWGALLEPTTDTGIGGMLLQAAIWCTPDFEQDIFSPGRCLFMKKKQKTTNQHARKVLRPTAVRMIKRPEFWLDKSSTPVVT